MVNSKYDHKLEYNITGTPEQKEKLKKNIRTLEDACILNIEESNESSNTLIDVNFLENAYKEIVVLKLPKDISFNIYACKEADFRIKTIFRREKETTIDFKYKGINYRTIAK